MSINKKLKPTENNYFEESRLRFNQRVNHLAKIIEFVARDPPEYIAELVEQAKRTYSVYNPRQNEQDGFYSGDQEYRA